MIFCHYYYVRKVIYYCVPHVQVPIGFLRFLHFGTFAVHNETVQNVVTKTPLDLDKKSALFRNLYRLLRLNDENEPAVLDFGWAEMGWAGGPGRAAWFVPCHSAPGPCEFAWCVDTIYSF